VNVKIWKVSDPFDIRRWTNDKSSWAPTNYEYVLPVVSLMLLLLLPCPHARLAVTVDAPNSLRQFLCFTAKGRRWQTEGKWATRLARPKGPKESWGTQIAARGCCRLLCGFRARAIIRMVRSLNEAWCSKWLGNANNQRNSSKKKQKVNFNTHSMQPWGNWKPKKQQQKEATGEIQHPLNKAMGEQKHKACSRKERATANGDSLYDKARNACSSCNRRPAWCRFSRKYSITRCSLTRASNSLWSILSTLHLTLTWPFTQGWALGAGAPASSPKQIAQLTGPNFITRTVAGSRNPIRQLLLIEFLRLFPTTLNTNFTFNFGGDCGISCSSQYIPKGQ